jgi:hypothetical protein
MRLHHAFILTKPGAPEAEALIQLGMQEGASNTHPGQGTANRRFFFADFGLELAYFTDVDEARDGPGRVIQSLNRVEATDGSPLGLVFRATGESDVDSFPGFPYQPEYFDEGQYFIVGSNADVLREPTCVLMPANLPRRPPQDMSGSPFENVTSVRVTTPAKTMSPVLATASQVERVDVQTGHDHLLEVEFGAGEKDEMYDLRPELPLVIRC